MGIEPTHQLVTGTLVLKTRRPTRRLGTSFIDNLLNTVIFVNQQLVAFYNKLITAVSDVTSMLS